MWWLLCLIAIWAADPTYVTAGEPPNWFSYSDSTCAVMVCNVVRHHGRDVELSQFAPAMGAAWSKQHAPATTCYVLPIKTTGLYLNEGTQLLAKVRGRSFAMIDATWLEQPAAGTAYTLATFAADFKLKDVTGFVLVDAGKRYELKPEDELK